MERDIPVAERIKPITSSPPTLRLRWFWFLIGLGMVGVGTGLAWVLPKMFVSSPISNASATQLPAQPSPAPLSADKILGHLPYPEAPLSELEPISLDGRIKLRQAAAREFQRMVADARAVGVAIVPISGFRSRRDQNYLFFEVKRERGQETRIRAKVSAPPGYSEHHTGYAVDVGDASAPETHLQTRFDQTAAFAWLEKNAAYYSFELSFPPNNAQGISYEPWHWRYVGDEDSLKTFYQAHQLVKQTPASPAQPDPSR